MLSPLIVSFQPNYLCLLKELLFIELSIIISQQAIYDLKLHVQARNIVQL